MTKGEIAKQLAEALSSGENFLDRIGDLSESWKAAGTGREAVEPILRFMEEHPALDFGSPGPLVHFVERFYDHEYVGMLLESVARAPTEHTLWMLNRVINDQNAPMPRERLVSAMEEARRNPHADRAAANERRAVSGENPKPRMVGRASRLPRN